MLVNPLHSKNAPKPILLTLTGIVILINPRQPSNAPKPILLMLMGIVILVNDSQFSNAFSPISTNVDGKLRFKHVKGGVILVDTDFTIK